LTVANQIKIQRIFLKHKFSLFKTVYR